MHLRCNKPSKFENKQPNCSKSTNCTKEFLYSKTGTGKLMNHVRKTLIKYNIIEVYNWVDSTTVLYWLKERGSWSQFVTKRVKQILRNVGVKWLYVPTKENQSDFGTRGVSPEKRQTCG